MEVPTRVAIALVLTYLASSSPCTAISSNYGFEFSNLRDAFSNLWFVASFFDFAIVPLNICIFSLSVFDLRMLPPPSTALVARSWSRLSMDALLSSALSVASFPNFL
jgi:hypothetical protein